MITKERAEEISREYYDKVFRYCMSISKSNYEDSLEITQEVFLVFSQKLSELEDDIIEHWLLAVAKKKAYDEQLARAENMTDEEVVEAAEVVATEADFEA